MKLFSSTQSIIHKRASWLAVSIIAMSLVLAITSVWEDSLIVDEIPHVGAGYSYLTKQDMRINPEHPPLAKDIAAIPLLFMDINQDMFKMPAWTTDVNGQWKFGQKTVFGEGNDSQKITRAVKMPMLLFFVASAWLIYWWGRKLFGVNTALIALILFAFSPTVIAHSRFVTTDMPALFGILFATYFFLKYLQSPSKKNFFLASIVFGIALLTKFSTFLLVPFLGLSALLWGFVSEERLKKQLISAIRWGFISVSVFIVGFILVVWPLYEFHIWNYPPERQYSDTENILSTYGRRTLVDPIIWMSDKPVLRAAGQYGLGLLMVSQRSVGGNTAYFLGETSKWGWKYYFPVVYIIKEPLAWWILAFISLLGLAVRARPPDKNIRSQIERMLQWARRHFPEIVMVLWLIVYWGVTLRSNLNIGVRHILPTYPFIILLVSANLQRISSFIWKTAPELKKYFLIIIVSFVGWYTFEAINIWPYYLTYFNQSVGGPSNGYKYVVDSNLDWGQDLKRFSDWVIEKDIEKIEFDYFGWADPFYYLGERRIWLNSQEYLNARDFIARNRSNGWLAVSATFRQGSAGPPEEYRPINYGWLNAYKPVNIIGNSIFVYRIR